MTTPRDEATALLAAALHPSGWIVITDTDTGEEVTRFSTTETAESVLRASPTLAADLEFAIAWRRVERALPEGWMLGHVGLYANQTWGSGWSVHALSDGGREEFSTSESPTAALLALAEALEALRG